MPASGRWWMTAQGQTYNASRRAELVDHGKDDGVGWAVLGAGRQMDHLARSGAKPSPMRLVKKLGSKAQRLRHRHHTACPAAALTASMTLVQRLSRKPGPAFPAMRHLAHMFGARLPLAAERRASSPIWCRWSQSGDTLAQIAFAVTRGNGADPGRCGDAAHLPGPVRAAAQSGQDRRH